MRAQRKRRSARESKRLDATVELRRITAVQLQSSQFGSCCIQEIMSLFGATKVENKDVEVANIPSDSISAVAWSPTADYLAVASWNNEVRIYEVGPGGQNQGKAMYSHEGPVLCLDWSKVSFPGNVAGPAESLILCILLVGRDKGHQWRCR